MNIDKSGPWAVKGQTDITKKQRFGFSFTQICLLVSMCGCSPWRVVENDCARIVARSLSNPSASELAVAGIRRGVIYRVGTEKGTSKLIYEFSDGRRVEFIGHFCGIDPLNEVIVEEGLGPGQGQVYFDVINMLLSQRDFIVVTDPSSLRPPEKMKSIL